MTGNMEWKLEHMDKIWGKMGGGVRINILRIIYGVFNIKDY